VGGGKWAASPGGMGLKSIRVDEGEIGIDGGVATKLHLSKGGDTIYQGEWGNNF